MVGIQGIRAATWKDGAPSARLPAEAKVEAAAEARTYIASEGAVGEHLADQLLLPFGLAGGGEFTATKLNRHALTNIEVVSSFLPVRFTTSQEAGCTRIRVTSDSK